MQLVTYLRLWSDIKKSHFRIFNNVMFAWDTEFQAIFTLLYSFVLDFLSLSLIAYEIVRLFPNFPTKDSASTLHIIAHSSFNIVWHLFHNSSINRAKVIWVYPYFTLHTVCTEVTDAQNNVLFNRHYDHYRDYIHFLVFISSPFAKFLNKCYFL